MSIHVGTEYIKNLFYTATYKSTLYKTEIYVKHFVYYGTTNSYGSMCSIQINYHAEFNSSHGRIQNKTEDRNSTS